MPSNNTLSIKSKFKFGSHYFSSTSNDELQDVTISFINPAVMFY